MVYALQVAAKEVVDIHEVRLWREAHKKKDPQPDEDPYYGSTSETISEYSSRLFIATMRTNAYHAYKCLPCLLLAIMYIHWHQDLISPYSM